MSNETELTSLLSNIRAKRDMNDFVVEPSNKGKKKVSQNPVPTTGFEPNNELEQSPTPSVLEVLSAPKAKLTSVKEKKIKNHHSDFLSKVLQAENTFSFEQNRRYYLDDRLFQTLVLLKLSGKIRNISTLVNVIVAQYLEENITDIDSILREMKS